MLTIRMTFLVLCLFSPNDKKWIFLKSKRKGQFRNVQDGISRPLDSREIKKTKAGTVLQDTLYIYGLSYLLTTTKVFVQTFSKTSKKLILNT